MQFVHRGGVLPLHYPDVREFFLHVVREILHGSVILQNAAVDLEVGNAAGKRIGHRFEDE